MKQYIVLDLEWNTAYSKRDNQFVNEIIEFGAVKLNSKFEIIDSFSSFVKPQIEKKLRGRTKTITNIKNEDVVSADVFTDVCNRFTKWINPSPDTVVLSWGDMDIRALISNCNYFYDSPRIPFIDNYVNLQAYFMSEKELPKGEQIGLSNAAVMINLNPDDFTHHRALGDSELAAVCFKAVYKKDSFKKNVLVCDEEFYKKIMFRPYVITDIDDILVDKNMLCCKCHECGNLSSQLSDWKFSKNNFVALYYCKSCKIKYRVSVQFKKTYSQLNVKKAVVVLDK